MGKKIFSTIGTMSGTSCDGVDVSFIRTDGNKIYHIGASSYLKYPTSLQKNIAALIKSPHSADLELLLETSNSITKLHAIAIKENLEANDLQASDVDLIGFHGQTIYHNPKKKLTLQIGNPQLLSSLSGIEVMFDFRNKNIAQGGEGAPLAQIYHRILCRDLKKPIAVLNIGGVSNVTYIDKNDKLLAFDTGPGCALLNDFIFKKLKEPYDKGGAIAASGKIHEDIVNNFIKRNSFFSKKPPKSLDRNEFIEILKDLAHLSIKDALASLTFFSAKTIYESIKFFPVEPQIWLACGGGRHNKFLMSLLSERFGLNIISIDEARLGSNVNGDFIESQTFAVLAVQLFLGIPIK
jgi:anhydro-N-acetylmuramic acid kinase